MDSEELSDLEDNIRTSIEVSSKALVLLYLQEVVFDKLTANEVKNRLKELSLYKFVSPKERRFLNAKKPSEKQKINLSWRIEAIEAMFWALGLIEDLTSSSSLCDVKGIKSIFISLNDASDKKILSAELRPENEIIDQREQIYEQHWQVRDARIHGRKIPDSLDSGVVYEKHYALNWVLGYMGQSWDEVTTDT